MNVVAEWNLPTRVIGRRVLCYDSVHSTNTLAAGYADDPTQDGLVILADQQTAGRGRQGRSWQSPAGSGVLLSMLLFPPENLRRPVVLTTLAAVAVCDSIYQSTGLQARIKWPNDVLIHGRKVCGILVEQGRGVVIGIGLNVNTRAEIFENAQLPQAGSLAVFTNRALDRDTIARELIQNIDKAYVELLAGNLSDLESRWRWHSGLLGKMVCVESKSRTLKGRLLEIGFSQLSLQTDDGQVVHFGPEEVGHVTVVSG